MIISKNRLWITVLTPIFISYFLNGQSGILSTGNEDDIPGFGSMSVSVGQIDYLNFSNGSFQVFEGIQTPGFFISENTFSNTSCLNNVIIPLNEDCSAILSSTMFTIPSINGLYIYAFNGDIPSSFHPDSIGFLDTVNGEGNWMYGIYSTFPDEKGLHQLLCWGTFITEDKKDPYFVGDNLDQYGTYRKVKYSEWSDVLSEGTFQPHLWSCWQSTNHGTGSFTWPNDEARTFDTIRFRAAQNGVLTIIGASQLNSGSVAPAFDPVLALYNKGGFNKDNPCQNLIGFAESTFIPNPLSGLGFANSLTSSSFSGVYQDQGDVFAPWLLHPHPMAKMEVKMEVGQEYTLLMTHRAEFMGSPAFKVYFTWNNYEAAASILDSAGLEVDSTFAYFDFLCVDLNAVIFKERKEVSQERYTGGRLSQMAGYLGTDTLRSKVDSAWYSIGHILLGQRDRIDTAFIDLEEFNISERLMDSLIYGYGFMPMVVENCEEWEVSITDNYTTYGDCGYDEGGLADGLNISGVITRTYLVRDLGSKTDMDTAFTQLIFRNPTLYDVRLPHYTVNIECDELTGAGLPSPAITGYPFVSTLTGFVDLTPTSSVCNLSAGYEDKAVVNNCANNKEFRREWTIYDWCRPGTTVVYHQLIRMGDFTAPVIIETTTSLTTNFASDDCSGSVTILRGSAQDLCGSLGIRVKLIDLSGATIIYSEQNMSSQGQKTNSGSFASITQSPGLTATVNAQGVVEIKGLKEGKYYVEWEAKDACGNASSERDSFTISDNISPSCVIDDLRTITLTDFQVGGNLGNSNPRGEAYLTADRLDEGSWDNCSEVSVQVRRMTTTGMSAWADQVGFTCADEGDSVLVEMVARAGADSTICWTYIKVEDKTIPQCREIGTVTMLCSDIPSGDLSENSNVWDRFFEDSITVTNTSLHQLCNIEFDANIETQMNIDQCGYGWVNRYYRVYRTIDTKEYADTCRMSIVFSEEHDFWVTFPADEMNAECGSLEEVKVTFNEGGCDLVTISKNDQKFDATADECYKILRTYRVMNWCEYDGAEQPMPVARRDWNRDGKDGDATTINVKYRQGVQHVYKDYKGRNVTVVGAAGSLNPTGSPQSDADLRDTVYRVGEQTAVDGMVYWESASPIIQSLVTTTLINNGTVQNRRNYVATHPTPVSTPNADDYIPQGFFEYTQHLKVYDEVAPELEVLMDELEFASYNNDIENGCPAPVSIKVKISDECTTNASELVVRDVLLDAGNGDAGSITFLNKKYDASNSNSTTLYTAEYATGTLTISSTELPQGEHKFTIVASDGCGNVQTQDIVFEVVDKKGPAPVCIEGFNVEMMLNLQGDGAIGMIRAKDFLVNSPIEDCSGDSGKYRITKLSSNQTVPNFDLAKEELILTCEDIDFTGLPLRVAVIAEDLKGNKDYCVTTINIQDNLYHCGFIIISGQITLENNEPAEDVEFEVNLGSVENSDSQGKYEVKDIPINEDLTIIPSKEGNIYEGISTMDLILMTQHILGRKLLETPYQIIAADVNNSGTVTTLDVIELRKIILRKQESFSNNKIWRFIPKSLVFEDPKNPWKFSPQIKEHLNINNVTKDWGNADFFAVKTGDIQQSVQARSSEEFTLFSEDIFFEKGHIKTVVFYGNREDVIGFEVGLKHRNLEIVKIKEEKLKGENFGDKYSDKEVILISWNGQGAQGCLFSIDFKAKKEGWLSEFLEVSPGFLNNEAYDQDGNLVPLGIKVGNNTNIDFALFQNYPNPFSDETFIRFDLPNSGIVEWVVYDMLGRELNKVRQDFLKGGNIITLKANELGADGLYFFELRYGDFRKVKKIVFKSGF